ncbi:MAG: HEPN domain-containing protein [Deltaproteobacteria bacterium]|nr:HEPN domain-containing protein [Deltaproteobacteria bacterium]
MPHDPARVDETRAWLAKASEDLRAAQLLANAATPLLDNAAFHAQQAVEKAMKGYLVWHDVVFRRTHDLTEVGQQCAGVDASLEPLCKRAERLSVFAWSSRYPGDPSEPDADEVRETLAVAQEVLDEVLLRLPPEVRP